ncbi:hypothetical protein DFS34DRAFT_688172, partial [Phlyctochytrium arcticum]
MDSTKTNIKEVLTCSNGITRVGNDFRGSYSAGQNIQISGSTISCTYQPETEQPYVGGNGISVVGKTISNTLSILPGVGIIVSGTPGGPYTISSIDNLQTKRTAEDPTETQTDVSEPKVYKSGSGSTVASSGGLIGGLSGLGGIFNMAGSVAAVPGLSSSALGAAAQLGGALTGGSLVGGFISIFGHERKQEKDEEGNGLYNPDNTPKLEPGSNVVIYTAPDALNCPSTRILFDTPPSCSYLGIDSEFKEQAINLDMLRQYYSQVIQPETVNLTGSLLAPLSDQLELTSSIVSALETSLNNDYQTKITSSNKIPYSNISSPPDLSLYLNRNIDLGNINTSIATKQNIISASNRLDYNLLSNIPNLALKQDLITSSNKIAYSNISGTPDLSPYLTRTTDLNTINASIATKQASHSNLTSLSSAVPSLPSLSISSNIEITNTTSSSSIYWTSGPTIARAQLGGHFVSNSISGDFIIRSGGGATANNSLRLSVNGTSSALDILSSGSAQVNTATDSSNSTTGSFIVLGGVGIVKKLYVGNDIYSNNLKVATETFVNTQIAAIPLANYTLLSTYNTRQTAIDSRFTPIETRQSQLKALSNLDILDLSTAYVNGILPIANVNTSTLQPIITSSNAASIKATLGLSSSASTGQIDYANILNKPAFDFARIINVPSYVLTSEYNTRISQLGSLANKSAVDLSTSDSIGQLDFARLSNVPNYVATSDYNTRITPIETKLTGYDTSITSKLLTLNLGT